jgi:hypothetical protein
MLGELERLAYEVSLKALERQENVVDELRSRTGTLLAASSLSASFLGARALDHPGATWLGLIALGLFGVSVGSAIYVLLPRTELILALKGSRIFTPDLGGQGLAETYRTDLLDRGVPRAKRVVDRSALHLLPDRRRILTCRSYSLERSTCQLSLRNRARFHLHRAHHPRILESRSVGRGLGRDS